MAIVVSRGRRSAGSQRGAWLRPGGDSAACARGFQIFGRDGCRDGQRCDGGATTFDLAHPPQGLKSRPLVLAPWFARCSSTGSRSERPREIRKPDIGSRPKPPALPPQRSSRRRRKASPLSIQPLGALKQVPGKAARGRSASPDTGQQGGCRMHERINRFMPAAVIAPRAPAGRPARGIDVRSAHS